MGLGDTVMNFQTDKRLQIVWNTGIFEEGEPVVYRQSIVVDPSMTEQQAYDAAYTLESLTNYSIEEIRLISTDHLGPIT